MIDMRSAGHDCVHQRQHFAARPGPADPAGQADGLVHDSFKLKAYGERANQQQASVRDEVFVVEGHLYPVDPMRYSTH